LTESTEKVSGRGRLRRSVPRDQGPDRPGRHGNVPVQAWL